MQLLLLVLSLILSTLVNAQTDSSFDGSTLSFRFNVTDDLYDDTNDWQVTRIESIGYGYWVTSESANLTGYSTFPGTLTHNANNLYVTPDSAIKSNETLYLEFKGALVDSPPTTGISTYTTIYNVWFQPVSGGNQQVRSFQSALAINWADYPTATPLLVADLFKKKRSLLRRAVDAQGRPLEVAEYIPEPAMVEQKADEEVGIYMKQ